MLQKQYDRARKCFVISLKKYDITQSSTKSYASRIKEKNTHNGYTTLLTRFGYHEGLKQMLTDEVHPRP